MTPCAAEAQGMQAQIPASEYNALVDLYNSASGASWSTNSGWLDPLAITWHGVYVAQGHVNYLYLNGNQLSGSIPSTLANLSQITALDLRSNQLNGSIPSTMGNLSQLQYLFLGGNQLSGSIPTSLGNLSQLLDLELDGNQLSGSIPTNLAGLSRLALLSLSDNRLSGSIPSVLENLSGLSYLYLDGNRLSGGIPANLGNAPFLYELDLSRNQLTGTVPDFTAFSGIYINVCSNYLNIASGSQSLTNIDAMINAGITVIYTPQFIPPILGPIIPLPGGALQVGLTGSPGQTYIIQTSMDLVNWAALTNLTLISSNGQFLDMTGRPREFYRAIVSP